MGKPPEKYFDPTATVGEGRRYPHDCSNKGDKSLIVTRTRKGWVWYCHRCQESGIRDLSGKSPAERIAFIKSLDVKPEKSMQDIRLPLDYTREIPPEGLVYLYKRGLSDADIKVCHIGFSPKYQRIIFPVYEGRKLVFYQGRTINEVTKGNPKYMNVYQVGRRDVFFYVNCLSSEDIAVVEDIVSAIRVGKVLNAVAVLSTHIPESLVLSLDNKYEHIYLWLDPDKFQKCVKLMHRYRFFDMNVDVVRSGHDPKFYSNDEIRRLVYGI